MTNRSAVIFLTEKSRIGQLPTSNTSVRSEMVSFSTLTWTRRSDARSSPTRTTPAATTLGPESGIESDMLLLRVLFLGDRAAAGA